LGLTALAYSTPILKKLVGTVEFWGYVRPATAAVGSCEINYMVTPRFTLDAGTDFGITDGGPRKRLMGGLTYAVGRFRGSNR
jgi:hypothetical protein